MRHDIPSISRHFRIEGEFEESVRIGTGHINDTYWAAFVHNGTRRRYIHQRINHEVFKAPARLMENVERITRHMRRKMESAGTKEIERRTLILAPARDGRCYWRDEGGNYWRTYFFIEGAKTYEAVEKPEQAYQAARAFGRFQESLTDLPGPRLHETIPDFHNTPKRVEALEEAIEADTLNRCASARAEIEFALRNKPMASRLLDLRRSGKVPERITHNDTKLNNVMLDDKTGEGMCVIDLDTVMPGLALYDFGDMVRTTTSYSEEDERDLSKVRMEMPLFEALVGGYLETAGGFLNQTEKEHLAFAGKLITFEIGVRFLTDYLAGDTYFRVHREGHNLDRCRTQFKLVESMTLQEEKMHACVKRHL